MLFTLHNSCVFDCRCATFNETMFAECQSLYENTTVSGDVYISGESVLDATEKNRLPSLVNITVRFAYIIILRLIGYIVLRTIRNPSRTVME